MSSNKILRTSILSLGAVATGGYFYLATFVGAFGWDNAMVLVRVAIIGHVLGSFLLTVAFSVMIFSKKRLAIYLGLTGGAILFMGTIALAIHDYTYTP